MKQLLANLNWTFVKAWWAKRIADEIYAYAVITACMLFTAWSIWGLITDKPKPKELTPLDLSVILTEKVNKQNAQIRKLETELDHVKRQLAGELPQIHGGVSYDTRRTD